MKNINFIKPAILSFAILFSVQSPVHAMSCSDAIKKEGEARKELRGVVRDPNSTTQDIIDAQGALADAISARKLACEAASIGWE